MSAKRGENDSLEFAPEQIELPLGTPASVGRVLWTLELEWARRIVATLSAKEVCFALNIKPSTLSEALAETPKKGKKTPKGLKAEWLSVLRVMANDEQRGEYLRLIAKPLHYVVSRPVHTPAETLRAVFDYLRREHPGALRDFERSR